MARLIDLDNPDVVFCGHDGDYLRYNIWEELPTVDAVPVVRCRDCKYFNVNRYKNKFCMNEKGLVLIDKNCFCSYGERKGGDE